MSGCRIGKVNFKSGGSVHVLNTPKRSELHNSVENMSAMCSREDAIFVAYTVLYSDRTSKAGWSYAEGITNSDMLGAIENMKTKLIDLEF